MTPIDVGTKDVRTHVLSTLVGTRLIWRKDDDMGFCKKVVVVVVAGVAGVVVVAVVAAGVVVVAVVAVVAVVVVAAAAAVVVEDPTGPKNFPQFRGESK